VIFSGFPRNKAFHDDIAFDALQLSRNVNKVSMEHLVAWKSVPTNSVDEKWIPPPPSIFKINFDTTIRGSFSLQAAISRNHNGQIIQQVTQVSQPCHQNMGEALFARLAVSLAISLRLNHFIIEGDSLIVILALQDPSFTQDWRISSTIESIPPDCSWSARKIDRSVKFCAHYVVHWAVTKVTTSIIPISPPPIPSIRIVSGKDPP
jgi:hypothetical protein